MKDLITHSWPSYELLDTGDGLRLERFGPFVIVRPDPNVLWPKTDPENRLWHKPDARFVGQEDKSGWAVSDESVRDGWPIAWERARFRVMPTPFRHVGLFPEQVPNWVWLHELVQKARKDGYKPRVLNLFSYTGAASIVAAQAGADVCHVDASAGSINWAKENAKLSDLKEDAIRWIVDDALKFVKREVRRESRYDIIVMDPPVFGRGPKGEIWRLEEQLAGLAEQSVQLLSDKPLGFLVNFYATPIYPESIRRLFQGCLDGKALPALQLHALHIQEEYSKKDFPSGFSLRS